MKKYYKHRDTIFRVTYVESDRYKVEYLYFYTPRESLTSTWVQVYERATISDMSFCKNEISKSEVDKLIMLRSLTR